MALSAASWAETLRPLTSSSPRLLPPRNVGVSLSLLRSNLRWSSTKVWTIFKSFMIWNGPAFWSSHLKIDSSTCCCYGLSESNLAAWMPIGVFVVVAVAVVAAVVSRRQERELVILPAHSDILTTTTTWDNEKTFTSIFHYV